MKSPALVCLNLLLGAVLAAVLMTALGCEPRRSRSLTINPIDEMSQKRSDLEQAIDMLARMDEFERRPATANVIAFLNTYLSDRKADKAWQPDPLVNQLPRNIRTTPQILSLGRFDATSDDSMYLEEALLLKQIGGWVTQQPLPAPMQAWLASRQDTLGPDDVADLSAAYLLFDWTIRNVLLVELPEQVRDEAAVPLGNSPDITQMPLPVARRGYPGPGYMAKPWHVVMLGHGDAWQRARVFGLLCRQQGLEVIQLATADPSDANQLRPWVAALWLGDQLYLFDTTLGLPLPTADGNGIATFEEVRENPQLLRALDVGTDHLYDYSAAETKSVTALLDASVEALSQRMQVLESGLVGDRQLRLTVDPSSQAERLRKLPGIANVMLWLAPIEASLFEEALYDQRIVNMPPRQPLFEERLLLENRTIVSQARYKHLRGVFSNSNERQGAKSLYIEARIPDAEIDSLGTNQRLQEQMGLLPQLERMNSPQQQAQFLESIKQRIRRGKQDCSYWLGIVHYESGNYDAAVNWFDQRTLQANPQGWWTGGARYNLGRCYEMLGAPGLAVEQYIADDSPQQHGNLLRARRLEERKRQQAENAPPAQ